MAETLKAPLDETQGNENHCAMGLVDIVGDLIKGHKARHHPLPEAAGATIRFQKESTTGTQ
jgi:HTH-type transcriptional regulator / antitoxin HigA